MSLIANGAGEQPTGFYNGVVTKSLRINDEAAEALTFTPSNASNLTTWTWSGWVKRATLGTQRSIFAAQSSSEFSLFFNSNDTLRVWTQGGNGAIYTTQLFRDVSAWYHIVLKSSTSSPFYNLYVNGSEITSFTYDNRANYPATNNAEVNTTVVHRIGADTMGGSLLRLGGYIAEVNFIDGTALTPTSFGETKNGVWIAKNTSDLTFGTNGYRLQFLQTGTSANSSGIGADTSGEDNHWAVANLAASDVVLDSPENNFATMNPLNARRNGYTLTEGNLKSTPSMAYSLSISTFANKSGLFYFEVLCLLKPSTNNNMAVGFDTLPALSSTQYIEKGVWDAGGVIAAGDGSGFSSTVGGYTTGDILSVAYNLDTGKGWFRKNSGDWVNSGDPENDSGNIFTFTSGLFYTPTFMGYNTQSGTLWIVNYGQDSSFAGSGTAQGNTDGNGIGDFYYEPPSGFLALCSANLPEPTIGPNSDTQADDHFNTVLWTGGSGDVAVSGVGFQPDWVWMKSRNNAQNHSVGDSSRGGTKLLSTSRSVAEATVDELHFTSDGFTSNTDWHTNNYTYVAWNWKANGATTTTNDASSTSVGTIDSVFQANPASGFSIVTYTGFSGASGTATVAHGLGVAPDMIIHKARTRNGGWWTQIPNLLSSAGHFMPLNETAAPYDLNSYGTMNVPTTSIFTINGVDGVGGEAANYIAYCFASVEGYSKIGKYTGNASANGTFVFTGFRPAWIIIKKSSASGTSWQMYDNKRDTDNVVENRLIAEGNNTEGVGADKVDFVSNGFKLRANAGTTNASATYIFMAFAEAPFKYANAR